MHWTHRAVATSSMLIIALGAAPSCGDERPRPTEDVDRVSTELTHGECGGYCRRITELGADLMGHYRQLPELEDPRYPPKERSFVISEQEWAGILEAASVARRQPWESSYGCPDCADQGALRLTIKSNTGETRTTTLDTRAGENPDPLQHVIDAVRSLKAELR